MRSLPAFTACLFLALATGTIARAETRVFIIANEGDGYGIDQCLARGDKCGAHAALSYCRSRQFASASSYRSVDLDEITGSVPKAPRNCARGRCNGYVAITCQR
jgi:hypothetical protein